MHKRAVDTSVAAKEITKAQRHGSELNRREKEKGKDDGVPVSSGSKVPASRALAREDYEEGAVVDVIESIKVLPVVLEEYECYAFNPLYSDTVTQHPETRPEWVGVSEDELGKDPVLRMVAEDFHDLTPVVARVTVRKRTQRESSAVNYIVRRFHPALIGANFTNVIYAKRRAGKTTILRDMMLSRRRFFPRVVVFTGTASDCEYHGMLPSTAIVQGFNQYVLFNIMQDQAERVGQLHMSRVNNKNHQLMLVFDDCLADNLRHQPLLNALFLNGRHLAVEIWVVAQDTKGLPPALAGNSDVVFVSRMRTQRDKETIREKFVDFLRNDNEYDELVDEGLLNLDDYPWTVIHAAYPKVRGMDGIYAGSFEREKETDRPLVMGDREFWAEREEELMAHPGGMELLTGPETDWDVITDHTPGFNLAQYVPQDMDWAALLGTLNPGSSS